MSALDPDIVAQLAEDLPAEAFAAVVETFAADAARLLDDLEAADRAGDGPAFSRTAHSLSGAAGVVGAWELNRLARRALDWNDAAARGTILPVARIHATRAIAALRGMVRSGA